MQVARLRQKARHQEGPKTSIRVSPYNVENALNDGLFVLNDFRPCQSLKLLV